jgi:hypothetical protein
VRQFTRADGQKAFRGALAQFDAGDVLAGPW